MHVIRLSSERALSSYHPIVPRAVRRTSSPTVPRSRNLWGDSSRAELVARTPRASSATTNNPQPELPATCLCAVFALQYRAT